MCGRAGQTKETLTSVPKHSPFKADYELINHFDSNRNLGVGQEGIVIGKERSSGNYSMFKAVFGFSPSSAAKPLYLFNARAEGSAGRGEEKMKFNEADDPEYPGPWNIGNNGVFAKAFKDHRCLFPVSWFFEGPKVEKLSKPFLIKHKDDSPIFLAGCASKYQDRITFTVLTTPASKLLQLVGHHRSPLIISEREVETYLDHDLPLKEIEKLIHPFDSDGFIAYPVDQRMKTPNKALSNNSEELLVPIGPILKVA